MRASRGSLLLFGALLVATVVLAGANTARAAGVTLLVNGEDVTVDAEPYLKNGRTMVPVKFIADKLGYKSEWVAATKQVKLSRGGDVLWLQVGSTTMYKGAHKTTRVPLDAAPEIQNDRTMVPAKAVTEAFGGSVSWEPTAKVASVITYKAEPFPKKEIVVGLIPSQEAQALADKAKPFAEKLQNHLKLPVKVYVGTDYTATIEAMGAKQVDVGMFGPQSYVLAHDRGYADVLLASVRNGSKTYRSQIVVAKDAPFQSLKDLKGKKIAFVDPASTSGYTYPLAMLIEAGLDPEKDVTLVEAGGHDKTILALLRGDVDAAFSFDDARDIVEKADPNVKKKTRILAKSDPIPNDVMSVRSDLSPYWKAKLKEAFKVLALTEDGKKDLKAIYNIDGFADAKDSEYDIVRRTFRLLKKS
ncbi:phosphate/phosphite/phosphonate ABC transporter substrate-binding protein [Hydrogenibacillus schlegelii]|uniref:phosphate/phosphite/phosphonate ABC transporter substrate-binding protein n=1 Tax=Hydrogenibacillus schlegelii TaxID=1484 RepID=UPI0009EF4E00|nr:phosphate/phosphite/phosphonate ABC transporter substrate-binding protein [Hydrogenibacillus schlegelii]